MMIVMQPQATEEQVARVCERLRSLGFDIHKSTGRSYTVLGAIGDPKGLDRRQFELMEGVKEVLRISEPYKLAGRSLHPQDSVLKIRNAQIGGSSDVSVMAGPCSVESKEQLKTIAQSVVGAGATFLRGGAYKPRTSPYAFQGLGQEGLELLREQADSLGGIPVVSEIMDARQLPGCVGKVDVIQIGARNMQNFELLKECGRTGIPVLLKRGMSSTIEEWLMAAEYVMSEGNRNVILCERGIRTFETATRNTLDLSAIPVVKEKTHLPVIVDPSHAMGRRDKILPMARAAVAAGADGLIVEVHHDPDNALSDGPQALLPEMFQQMMEECDAIARAIGRALARPSRAPTPSR
jgi:3-deoxy-7-phosphoheptulonate synthase